MGLLRCWIIRGSILLVLAAVAAAGWVLHDWVSPERVRAALTATLQEKMPDVDVEVGSARLRLFGGISVSDLKLTRRGEPQPFFEAPSAVIYHDKEQLNRGRIAVRKLELVEPTVRVDRLADGSWNLGGLSKPGSADAPIPTVVVHKATVIVTDRRDKGSPPVAFVDARFSLMNDPLPVLKIEAKGKVVPAPGGVPALDAGLVIPVAVAMKLHRQTKDLSAKVEVDDLAIGPDLAPVFEKLNPQLGPYLSRASARVGIKGDVTVPGNPALPPTYDVRVEVRDGRFEDGDWPLPLEHITASVHVQDGKVRVEKGAATLGKANVEFSLETRSSFGTKPPTPPTAPAELPVAAETNPRLGPLAPTSVGASTLMSLPVEATRPAATNPTQQYLQEIEEKFERIEVTVHGLVLNEDLFSRLPAKAQRARELFAPTGTLDAAYRFQRAGPDWKREVDIRPDRVGILYEKFRYPARDVTGSVKKVTASDGTDEFRVSLTGTASGRRIELSGKVAGEGPDPLVDLKLSGTDIPVDERLFAALPPKYAEALGKLRATARGDFVVDIRQPLNVNRCENTFRIWVYDGTMNYKHFPVPLTKVKGQVVILVTASDTARPLLPGLPLAPDVDTDRVEIRDFVATHAGGKLWVSGDNATVPGTKDRRLALRIQGENCPIDEALLNALKEVRLGDGLNTFAPAGELTFGADVEILDRAVTNPLDAAPLTAHPPLTAVAAALPGEPPFNPAEDLKVTLNFKGPSVTPKFFPCTLDDLAGVLRYQNGKLDLVRCSARRGHSRLELDAAEVRFGHGDELWANLGNLTVRPLVLDKETLDALPAGLQNGVRRLNPQGPMELAVKHLVVQVPPTGSAPPSAAPAPLPLVRGQLAASEALHAPRPDADPVLYWNLELRMAGASLDAGLEWRDVHGALASVGRYEGTHLGTVLGNAWLDHATVSKQPISAAKMAYRVRPQQPDPHAPGRYLPPVLELPDLTATMYQGTIGGEARVTLADQPRYRVWLTASGVQLDELAERLKLGTGAELRGLAQGKILLENQPDPKSGLYVLTGAGQVDVPSGRLYNLPVMMPLLKLLKLQAPDQTAFEEAHAVFDLRGDRVYVRQLDLIGSAVSLGGSGEVAGCGEDVRFEFYTIWSQALRRWMTTPLGDVTSLLSGNLFKIEMVKEQGEMKYYPHMLPVVTDPVRAVAERLRNRFDRPLDAEPQGLFRASGR